MYKPRDNALKVPYPILFRFSSAALNSLLRGVFLIQVASFESCTRWPAVGAYANDLVA